MPSNGHAPGPGNLTYTYQSHHQAYAQSQTMLYNPEIPHLILYTAPDQQGPTTYVSPQMHHTMTTQIPNTIPDSSNSQHQHRLTSTSKDEDDTHNNSNNEWQVIRRTKREKIHSTPLNTPDTITETQITMACSQK